MRIRLFGSDTAVRDYFPLLRWMIFTGVTVFGFCARLVLRSISVDDGAGSQRPMRAHGLVPGDRVRLSLENCGEFFELLFGS
jgi:hypothetical protein